MGALLAACHPSVLQAFVEIAFTRVDVGTERRNVTSAATLRKEVPGMASSIWTACSRMAMRSVQGRSSAGTRAGVAESKGT